MFRILMPLLPQPLLARVAASSVRVRALQPIHARPASAAMIMALGIFGLAALPQIEGLRSLCEPFALATLAIWLVMAATYVHHLGRGQFNTELDDPIGRYAVGAWVAASAVLLRLVNVTNPEWQLPILWLGLFTVTSWLWFVFLIAAGLRRLLATSMRGLVPGTVLLSTVSTQALALALFDLLEEPSKWRWLGQGLWLLGLAFYATGFALIALSHCRAGRWTLRSDWSNTNCILHGALSISGLSAAAWQLLPAGSLLALWLATLGLLVLIESIEIARLTVRVGAYGWKQGAFTYDVSQWARNFTFGMFYAFTLALSRLNSGATGSAALDAVQSFILTIGPVLVLALLVVEMGLYVGSRLRWRAA